MFAGSRWGPRLVVLLFLLAVLLAASGPAGRPSEAAPATLQPQATVQRGTVRVAASPTLLGDINNDRIVDIRDYGLWRQQFGLTGPTATPTVTVTSTVTATPTATVTATPTLTGRAYVANRDSNSVTVIDTTTNTAVGAPIPVGSQPAGVGVDPSVHRAYVANFSNTVSVIDTTTNAVVGAPIPVGSAPFGVGMDPTVHRAYVANSASNTVTVIDTTTNTVVGAPIPVGTGPLAVGIGP